MIPRGANPTRRLSKATPRIIFASRIDSDGADRRELNVA
jgi:hypothetical protein